MRTGLLTAAGLCTVIAFASCQSNDKDGTTKDLPDGLYAEISTTRGTILVSLAEEEAPMTVANFVGLAEGSLGRPLQGSFPASGSGEPYFNGLTFHRVIDDFMIQTGDPTGTGSGGPGYRFPDEFSPELRHSGPGTLSMANSGANTNGSQFFITHVATPWLDDKHSVFGQVVDGQKVVDGIEQGDTIKEIKILRVGNDLQNYAVTASSFKELVEGAADREIARVAAKREAALKVIEQQWPNAKMTESGIRYIILQEGSGTTHPTSDSSVKVNYTGKLLDGTVFDSTSNRGTPAEFLVRQVITGWQEALKDMVRGEKRLVVLPPDLAYGERGYPGLIPPSSFLVFEMELLDFN